MVGVFTTIEEYAHLMEAVDHATNYDSTSCLLLLGHRELRDIG